MQALPPFLARHVGRGSTNIATCSLIRVLKTTIRSHGPHQVWYCFGQYPPVLLTFFELLLRLFLLIDVGAGTNPVQDRALCISLGHASDKKPAIRPACAFLQA